MTSVARGVYDGLVRVWTPQTLPVAVPRTIRHMHAPTMQVENTFRASDTYRKIHIEYARLPNVEFEIVHHVAYPRVSTDLPIVGLDILFSRGNATMAIADLSSSSSSSCSEKFEWTCGGKRRQIPDWGLPIFSEQCLFVSDPDTSQIAKDAVAFVEWARRKTTNERKDQRFQTTYCEQQRKNMKTRGMLAAAFGPERADEYMEIMFS